MVEDAADTDFRDLSRRTLPLEGFECLLELVEDPPRPTEQLKKLMGKPEGEV